MAEQFGKFVKNINLGNEGDGVDTLHFSRTPAVCMFFSAFLMLIKYMNIKPILCWVPYEFTNDNWVEYALYYCWASNTYLPDSKEVFSDTVVKEVNDGQIHYIRYYQWVPLIFITVAIIFYLPRLLWQGILEAEGINITAMVRSVNGFESALASGKREKDLTSLARYMRVHFMYKKKQSTSAFKKVLGKIMCVSRSDASYVGRMYLMLKCTETFISVGILFFMNLWLDGFQLYGLEVLVAAFSGNYEDAHKFPLISLCQLQKRDLGDNKNYQFQCLLTMNMFNEKIFVLFWFYLFYVAIVTIINTFGWFMRVLRPGARANYIRTLLRLSKSARFNPDNPDDQAMFKDFVWKFLKPDGVFTFRLINANTTTVVMHEIVGKLWNMYKDDRLSRENLNGVSGGDKNKIPLK